jgi:hypothetical protein
MDWALARSRMDAQGPAGLSWRPIGPVGAQGPNGLVAGAETAVARALRTTARRLSNRSQPLHTAPIRGDGTLTETGLVAGNEAGDGGHRHTELLRAYQPVYPGGRVKAGAAGSWKAFDRLGYEADARRSFVTGRAPAAVERSPGGFPGARRRTVVRTVAQPHEGGCAHDCCKSNCDFERAAHGGGGNAVAA